MHSMNSWLNPGYLAHAKLYRTHSTLNVNFNNRKEGFSNNATNCLSNANGIHAGVVSRAIRWLAKEGKMLLCTDIERLEIENDKGKMRLTWRKCIMFSMHKRLARMEQWRLWYVGRWTWLTLIVKVIKRITAVQVWFPVSIFWRSCKSNKHKCWHLVAYATCVWKRGVAWESGNGLCCDEAMCIFYSTDQVPKSCSSNDHFCHDMCCFEAVHLHPTHVFLSIAGMHIAPNSENTEITNCMVCCMAIL